MVVDEEQFKLVPENSNAAPIPVITGGMYKQPILAENGDEIEIKKNGYLYVFVSNESAGSVYFDDLVVKHTSGPLVAESHYYSYGVKMEGISSHCASTIKNKNQFIDKERQFDEFSDGSGLEMYDFDARFYDQQLGRFFTQDPLSGATPRWSPYTYGFDNPSRYLDPTGMLSVGADGLTNEQWIESSKPDADPNAASRFRAANRETQQVENERSEFWQNIIKQAIATPTPTKVADDEWHPLYKKDLVGFLKSVSKHVVDDNYVGRMFEYLFNEYVTKKKPGNVWGFNFRYNTKKYTMGGDRNTVPDFVADVWTGYNGEGGATYLIEGSVAYEVKAKYGGVYLSTSTGQLKGHIDNLEAEFAGMVAQFGECCNFKPVLNVVTTFDVTDIDQIYYYGQRHGVEVAHYVAYYRFTNGDKGVEFKFERAPVEDNYY